MAAELNQELQTIGEKSDGRIYGFGTLAVHAYEQMEKNVKELERLKTMDKMRGVILAAHELVCLKKE